MGPLSSSWAGGRTSWTAHRLRCRARASARSPCRRALSSHRTRTSAAASRWRLGLQGDVRKPDDTTRCVQQTLDRFGRLDVLVNCAAGNFLVSTLCPSLLVISSSRDSHSCCAAGCSAGPHAERLPHGDRDRCGGHLCSQPSRLSGPVQEPCGLHHQHLSHPALRRHLVAGKLLASDCLLSLCSALRDAAQIWAPGIVGLGWYQLLR